MTDCFQCQKMIPPTEPVPGKPGKGTNCGWSMWEESREPLGMSQEWRDSQAVRSAGCQSEGNLAYENQDEEPRARRKNPEGARQDNKTTRDRGAGWRREAQGTAGLLLPPERHS